MQLFPYVPEFVDHGDLLIDSFPSRLLTQKTSNNHTYWDMKVLVTSILFFLLLLSPSLKIGKPQCSKTEQTALNVLVLGFQRHQYIQLM